MKKWTAMLETSRGKDGTKFNQLVVNKGLRQQVMSVDQESAFSGPLGAKKLEYSRTTFGQDYARTSLDSDVPVMCTKEQSKRVLSRKNH